MFLKIFFNSAFRSWLRTPHFPIVSSFKTAQDHHRVRHLSSDFLKKQWRRLTVDSGRHGNGDPPLSLALRCSMHTRLTFSLNLTLSGKHDMDAEVEKVRKACEQCREILAFANQTIKEAEDKQVSVCNARQILSYTSISFDCLFFFVFFHANIWHFVLWKYPASFPAIQGFRQKSNSTLKVKHAFDSLSSHSCLLLFWLPTFANVKKCNYMIRYPDDLLQF